jgi:hypothetical protein
MTARYYTGVGSRETPPDILALMTTLAVELRAAGYTLRSGGARGADEAFAAGAGSDAQIFLPWLEYNGVRGGIPCGYDIRLAEIAARCHPHWKLCNSAARKLHTRNVATVLGKCDPPELSEFVVCWTPGGYAVGGTGQALRVAKRYNVPVYNLADWYALPALRERLAHPVTAKGCGAAA